MTTDLPDYVLDPSPLALFTRLQRVGLHLERLQAEAMAEIDMTFADYTLVATLHREPAPHTLPVSRLAELVLRPMGSITQVVDRLERAGLVTRRFDPDDRRRVLSRMNSSLSQPHHPRGFLSDQVGCHIITAPPDGIARFFTG